MNVIPTSLFQIHFYFLQSQPPDSKTLKKLGFLGTQITVWSDPLACLKMKAKKPSKLKDQHQDGHSSPFKLGKLFDPDASWDKDQLGDVLHWMRQAIALLCGLIWGAIPLVGGIWLILFLGLSTAIVYGYYALILKVDEEDYGGHGALLQEGLFASMTLFLLAWILVYSLVHFWSASKQLLFSDLMWNQFSSLWTVRWFGCYDLISSTSVLPLFVSAQTSQHLISTTYWEIIFWFCLPSGVRGSQF